MTVWRLLRRLSCLGGKPVVLHGPGQFEYTGAPRYSVQARNVSFARLYRTDRYDLSLFQLARLSNHCRSLMNASNAWRAGDVLVPTGPS